MAQTSNQEKDVSGAPPSNHVDSPLRNVSEYDGTGTKIVEMSLEQQQLNLLGPAYLLELDHHQQHVSRRRLDNAEEMRASIPQQREKTWHEHRLFVIRGLPADFLQVLKDVLSIDARFLDAHIARRSYNPIPLLRRSRLGERGTKSTFACFDYPELLASTKADRQVPLTHAAGTSVDIVGESPVHTISLNGELAVFCRASLWLGDRANVLLLDRPAWNRPSSDFRRARYRTPSPGHSAPIAPTSEKTSGVASSSDTLQSEYANSNNEIPSFETRLYEILKECVQDGGIDAWSLVEDIAIQQWTEFFEALSTDLPSGAAETASLYWQAQKSLERNLSNSEFYDKLIRISSTSTATWQSLLSRLSRWTSLQSQLNPIVANIQLPPSSLKTQPSTITSTGLPPQTARRNSNSDEQNKHSLDRVSYMGGFLLPLSIVSSILSMSDPFNPGGNMFYVFWAVSIPLVFITILIIYADSIRKAEVWIEVAGSTTGSEKPEEAEISTPKLEAAVPYSETVRIGSGATDRVEMAALAEEEYPEEYDEPTMMVEKLFKDTGNRKWKKEQLGWLGACKAVFRIYKLKKGRPPNWAMNGRHGRPM
ncbi:hypothetical protein F5Y13DRAFT_184789 [Hypoxylon sp. FL1857]|nr:hypothetical protein F5Y13DRAFT_184789 [Hypoxylon sp. FL1857]